MKRIRQILSWISRKIIILAKIIVGFGKYLWKILKKIMKVIWKGGKKMGWVILVLLNILVIGMLFLFCRFTKVEEGTAKAVMSFGGFRKIIFQWKDHWMDEEGNILKKDEESEGKRKKVGGHIFGGLWWYGFWPIHKIHRYPLRWTDLRRVEEAGEKIEKPQFHDEILGHVMLKPAVYWTKIFKVETCPPERIPVDIDILITMRIVNPYNFLFIAPPTPLEDVLARIDALMRARVSMLTVDELIALRGKSEVLWDGGEGITGLKDEKLIKETLPKWGLEIAEKGVDIKSIGLPPEYQKAAAAKREQEMIAAGRSEKIIGTLISSAARAVGRDEKEVQVDCFKDPKAFYAKHKIIIENIMSQLSWEEKAGLRIETPGATPFGGEFLRLIGAALRMPMGGKEKEDKKPNEPEKEETEEEKEEEEKELSPEAERKMKRAREALETLRKQGKRHKKK